MTNSLRSDDTLFKALLDSLESNVLCFDHSLEIVYISPSIQESYELTDSLTINDCIEPSTVSELEASLELFNVSGNDFFTTRLYFPTVYGYEPRDVEIKNVSYGADKNFYLLTYLEKTDFGACNFVETFSKQEALLNLIPIPLFYINKNLEIQACNLATSQAFGLERNEIVGQVLTKVATFNEEYERQLATLLEGPLLLQDFDPSVIHEVTYKDFAGRDHFVHENRLVCYGGVGEVEGAMISFLDQTNSRKIGQKLWEELNFNMLILETAESLILVTDDQRNILRFNSACESTSGFKLSDVAGSKFEDYFALSDDRERIQLLLDVGDDYMFRERGVELPYMSSEGSKRIISWSFAVIYDNNEKRSSILAVGNDITDRKKAELDALRHQKQLIQADKLTSLGTLVAGVAHEINNPNNFIVFNTPQIIDLWEQISPVIKEVFDAKNIVVEDMEFDEIDEYLVELLNGISQGADRIRKIIKNLKNYVQEKPIDMSAVVNINAAIDGSLLLLNNLIKKSSKKFTVDIERDLPEVNGDEGMLEQVLINLIQNACHALPDTNASLSVRTFYDKSCNGVVIEVADSGRGIAPEALKFITDPFFTTKRSSGGTGLGLSISSNIMKDHGGQLKFESVVGEGTTAQMILPVAE